MKRIYENYDNTRDRATDVVLYNDDGVRIRIVQGSRNFSVNLEPDEAVHVAEAILEELGEAQ